MGGGDRSSTEPTITTHTANAAALPAAAALHININAVTSPAATAASHAVAHTAATAVHAAAHAASSPATDATNAALVQRALAATHAARAEALMMNSNPVWQF